MSPQCTWASQVARWVKNPPAKRMRVWSLDQEDPLEEGTATHSNILACRIPGTEEPGRVQSMGLQSQTRLKRLSTHTNVFALVPSPLYSFTRLLLLFTNCILLCGSPRATPEFLKGREQDAFTTTQVHTVLSSAHGLFSEILTANIGATSACQ